MARTALPVFPRDLRPGLMEQFSLGEPKDFGLTSDNAGPEHFRARVADDDEIDLFLSTRQLGKGWPAERSMLMECAADGAGTLANIRRNHSALLVLVWSMPHWNGGEVLRAVRADGLRIPVVVVSGQPGAAIAPALETMAGAFVNKDDLDPIRFGNPIQKGPEKLGPDPELLFAGAYSDCYRGVLCKAAKKLGTPIEDSTVRSLVSLVEENQGRYGLAVELHAQLP